MEMQNENAQGYMVDSEAPSSVAGNETAESIGGNGALCSIENPPGNIGQNRHPLLDNMAVLGYFDDSHSYLPQETLDRILLRGRNSPGSRPEGLYAGPPVGYIPADQPGGPCELPPDRYGCPVSGCRHPFGLAREGYGRTSLGFHIRVSHGGSDKMWEVIQQVRDRVMALRFERDFCPAMGVFAGSNGPVNDLVRDLDEIREWEQARRFVVPDTALFSSARRARLAEYRRLALGGDDAEEGQVSGLLPFQFRTKRYASQSNVRALHSREQTCSPQTSRVARSLTKERLLERCRVEAPTSVEHGCR